MEIRKDQVIIEIFADLASNFRQQFMENETTAISNFYLSETGQKILANSTELYSAGLSILQFDN